MKVKNCEEIFEKIDYCNIEIDGFNKQIGWLKERIALTDLKSSKRYLNTLITNYNDIINDRKKEISSYRKILKKNSTFPYSMLMPFLTSVLSEKEGVDYLNTHLVINESVIFDRTFPINYASYCLIYSSECDEEVKVVENTFMKSHNMYFYNKVLGDSKKLFTKILEDENLIDENGLKICFRDFPYLEDIAYNLIDRRLREPNKHLNEILDEELENIKNQEVKKIKNLE